MDCYTIENLTFSYPESKERALKNINLSIKKGEFITLFGKSGCGKTTLLRLLKPTLAPFGDVSGKILFEKEDVNSISKREASEKIGFVMQNPDSQIVTDKVYHELAFGLESLGFSNREIRTRVSEMASFFGIETWFYKNTDELSGGQKQILNLASIMAMQPSVLILDEPTSQLDPICASEFLNMVKKINTELGVSVILSEHRLEETFLMSDRVVAMDNGEIVCDAKPQLAVKALKDSGLVEMLPVYSKVFSVIDSENLCPVNIREARERLSSMADDVKSDFLPQKKETKETEIAVELEDVWFKYEKNLPDVLKGLSLKAYKGEMLCILGGNGTGKTTALSAISGILNPYRGKVFLYETDAEEIDETEKFNEFLGVLPQNPQSLFVKKTVALEFFEMLDSKKYSEEERQAFIIKIARLCKIDALLDRHPYDLSGGEQQRTALAKVLLTKPKILLLDEPTKGLDNYHKKELSRILTRLKESGVCIIMVSHDIEFCAKYADRCALVFDGNITSISDARTFFAGNSFYTTTSNKMARHIIKNAVIPEDIINSFGYEAREDKEEKPDIYCVDENDIRKILKKEEKKDTQKKKKSGLSIVFGTIFAFLFIALSFFGFKRNDNTLQSYIYSLLLVVFSCGSLMCFFSGKDLAPAEKTNKKLSKRTLLASIIVLLLVPLTIFVGMYYFGERKYYFISLLIILEVIIPFFAVFEGRKPQARELVIISVMCALATAGRIFFAFLPQFKPVVAIVIISGVCFGAETGFLVGAITGFVSNMFLSQGPWTPWQMFAFGIIGFLAGVLFTKGVLKKSRISLCIYGFLSTVVIYGAIMNPASVLMFVSKPTWDMITGALISGLSFDIIHAVSTVFFLWMIAPSMIEKLERIKTKYGLLERN